MMIVRHSYHGNSKNSYDRGEIFSIKTFENGKTTELNYNLTKDKVFEYSNKTKKFELRPITLKEKIDLYWDLASAVSYAEEITINNMVVNESKQVCKIK